MFNSTRRIKKCDKNYCDKIKKETYKIRKNMYKDAKKKGINIPKMTKEDIDKGDKLNHEQCMAISCNPGCKGTIFENGKSITKERLRIPYQEERRKNLSKQRRKLFGKRLTVLQNNFYEKYSKKEIEKYKKNGAISGCLYHY